MSKKIKQRRSSCHYQESHHWAVGPVDPLSFNYFSACVFNFRYNFSPVMIWELCMIMQKNEISLLFLQLDLNVQPELSR